MKTEPDAAPCRPLHIFGPVPSRRLGRSLGVDVIPAKTCTYDCLYCESGRTTHLSIKRRRFVDPSQVMKELNGYFADHPHSVDAITFSAAGEPLLYDSLGTLIHAIKSAYPSIPLVVITNGALLSEASVRAELLEADCVMPSLDAAQPSVFRAINRPHPALDLQRIIEGLMAFRSEYSGRYDLEVLLVKGINDRPQHLRALRRIIERIDPDRLELNTVVRPPAESGVEGLDRAAMERAAEFFPATKVRIIGAFANRSAIEAEEGLAERILTMVDRRPCTAEEMAASLAVRPRTLSAALAELAREARIEVRDFAGKSYICPRR